MAEQKPNLLLLLTKNARCSNNEGTMLFKAGQLSQSRFEKDKRIGRDRLALEVYRQATLAISKVG
jgi:hypothetical protein